MLRLSSQTQQSRVRAQLELLLRNAEPGERLPSEPALAKRFDVSRTTIREVMSQLETEGFAFFSTRFHIGEEDRILTRRCLYTADEHFCVLAEDSFPLAFLSKGQRVQLLGSNNTDLRLFLFLATGRAACQDETTISVAQPEDYPFLESLLEDKQHPLLFLSSMCLDNHNEPFISSQIYSDTDYIKYQLNRRIV